PGLLGEAGRRRGGVGVRPLHRGRQRTAAGRGGRYGVPHRGAPEVPGRALAARASGARASVRVERRGARHARRGRARVPGHARADPADREPGAEEAPRARRQREAARGCLVVGRETFAVSLPTLSLPVPGRLRRVPEQWFDELAELLRIPSISADEAHAGDVVRAGEWVRDVVRGAGGNRALVDWNGEPLVIGELRSSGGGDAPTILCYGHFDVQPPDPLELWDSPPFEPEIRGEYLYGR